MWQFGNYKYKFSFDDDEFFALPTAGFLTPFLMEFLLWEPKWIHPKLIQGLLFINKRNNSQPNRQIYGQHIETPNKYLGSLVT